MNKSTQSYYHTAIPSLLLLAQLRKHSMSTGCHLGYSSVAWASGDPFLFTPRQSCGRLLADWGRGGSRLRRPGPSSSLRCGPLSNGNTSFSTPLPAHSARIKDMQWIYWLKNRRGPTNTSAEASLLLQCRPVLESTRCPSPLHPFSISLSTSRHVSLSFSIFPLSLSTSPPLTCHPSSPISIFVFTTGSMAGVTFVGQNISRVTWFDHS